MQLIYFEKNDKKLKRKAILKNKSKVYKTRVLKTCLQLYAFI